MRKAFTERPLKALNKWYVILEKEWLQKIGALVGDGASELGLRRSGKPVEEAKAGDNLFHKLQQRCRTVLGARWPCILGFWCTNHRIDIVAAKPEKEIQYVQELLSFFRSVVGHVMFSTRAQGILEYIAEAMYADHGVNEGAVAVAAVAIFFTMGVFFFTTGTFS